MVLPAILVASQRAPFTEIFVEQLVIALFELAVPVHVARPEFLLRRNGDMLSGPAMPIPVAAMSAVARVVQQDAQPVEVGLFELAVPVHVAEVIRARDRARKA